jgi:hypothetical protein
LAIHLADDVERTLCCHLVLHSRCLTGLLCRIDRPGHQVVGSLWPELGIVSPRRRMEI